MKTKYKNSIVRLTALTNLLLNIKLKVQGLMGLGLKMLGIILIFLLSSITAICQRDTLTKPQIDSLISWIGAINTDLKDYDLLKQKSHYQGEQIKGLEAIRRKQNSLGIRTQIKLSGFSSQIIKLETQNNDLQAELKSVRRKSRKRSIENWLWRGVALTELYFAIRWIII